MLAAMKAKSFRGLVDDYGAKAVARQTGFKYRHIRMVYTGKRGMSPRLTDRLRAAFGAEFSADLTVDERIGRKSSEVDDAHQA